MGVVCLVCTMHTILQQMQRHAETFETKLGRQTELFEAEEVFVNVFGKVTTNELIAAVLECARAICTHVFAQGGTLFKLETKKVEDF